MEVNSASNPFQKCTTIVFASIVLLTYFNGVADEKLEKRHVPWLILAKIIQLIPPISGGCGWLAGRTGLLARCRNGPRAHQPQYGRPSGLQTASASEQFQGEIFNIDPQSQYLFVLWLPFRFVTILDQIWGLVRLSPYPYSFRISQRFPDCQSLSSLFSTH